MWMKFLSSYKVLLLGIILGSVAGFAYYYFIGCASGTCLITSRPLNSTLYGGMMGGMISNIFVKSKNQ